MRSPIARRHERRAVTRVTSLIGDEIVRHHAELPRSVRYREGLIAAHHIATAHLESL